jgi:hypothetical protein
MWSRVDLVKTDVSEERITLIFWVETIGQLEMTLAVNVKLLTLFPVPWFFFH